LGNALVIDDLRTIARRRCPRSVFDYVDGAASAEISLRRGIRYALSTMGTTSIEDLATAVPSGRKWFQLYLWRDRAAA
jgi:isopentenyl diphosphate isomerase/L-lactate dehydrogenase-like FMN-dependent dehydrogenase